MFKHLLINSRMAPHHRAEGVSIHTERKLISVSNISLKSNNNSILNTADIND